MAVNEAIAKTPSVIIGPFDQFRMPPFPPWAAIYPL